MRIERISATGVSPIERFEADGLTDVVVVAGANGAGKTRLIAAVLSVFESNQRGGAVALRVGATCDEESQSWGKQFLDTAVPGDAQALARTLQRQRPRSRLQSSVLNFESDRTIQTIQPLTFGWEIPDVLTELVGWQTALQPLRARFQDTVHALFKMVRRRRDAIAKAIEPFLARPADATGDLIAQLAAAHPDPVRPFSEAFSLLLAPKTLAEPDPSRPGLFYDEGGQRYPVASLSSGEREVVNIVFDFLLRSPQDCIVFFDEPELHLHPELSNRLLLTLSSLGARNQFVFATHSPEIISASLENTVIFVTPRNGGANQAVPVRESEEANEALREIGQSIGVIALGKRIVLIEGAKSSLDKQTYAAVVKDRFPNLVLVPSGDRHRIASFAVVEREVLRRALWGVQFFMLCDGDTRPGESDADGRLRRLPRYHVENYFLDEAVIAKIFEDLEPAGSWLRSPPEIRARLLQLARRLLPYAVALTVSARLRESVGNVDIMPGRLDGDGVDVAALLTANAEGELERAKAVLSNENIVREARSFELKLLASLNGDTEDWKRAIPGKQLLAMFASGTQLGPSRFKTAYLRKCEGLDPGPFTELIDIFKAFSEF